MEGKGLMERIISEGPKNTENLGSHNLKVVVIQIVRDSMCSCQVLYFVVNP